MQKEIKEKISTLEGHITVQSFNNNINQNSKNPISPSDVFIDATIDIPSVNRIEKIISSFGIVRTKTDFHGCYFKGVNHSYNWSGIEKYVLEGRVPNINDSTFSNEILIPKIIANKLKLDINDRIQMVFSRENSNPSLIQLEVSGIYSTGFDDLDSKYIFGDIDHLIRINKWDFDWDITTPLADDSGKTTSSQVPASSSILSQKVRLTSLTKNVKLESWC